MAKTNRICSIEGCGKRTVGRGMCSAHYQRFMTHGDPLKGGTAMGEATRFLNEVVLKYKGDDCLEWLFAKGTEGYGRVQIGTRLWLAHRYVCTMVHGQPPIEEYQAAHECGNRACVNPNHLSWKTRLENKADELVHGTRNHGERNGQSRITEGVVIEIRALQGVKTQQQIADQFGVSREHIRDIHNRKRWAHLP